MNKKIKPYDYFLDITQDVCPITFVKTRLQVEKMNEEELLKIRLLSEETAKSVSDSLMELGHRIVTLGRDQPDSDVYTLVVQKK